MAVEHISKANVDGTTFGQTAADKVSMYGVTPIVQRASALQATTQSSLTTFMTINTNVAALLLEISQTLIAIGIWKGAA
jgi:hypothetical protein